MKFKFKKYHWIFGLIILLAIFLRLWQISSIPPSLNWDEAAIGWNAKSIFHTRRDEYGTRLPWTFKSFGDYKAPLYIYLTAPLVGLFGITPFNIRVLSALAGVASVVVIYFLTKELINRKSALIAAVLFAIAPWSIMLSRAAFEQNLALLFILLGTYWFLLSFKKVKFLWLSVFAWILSLYTYHSPKIFLPVFITGLIIIYRKKLKKQMIYPLIFGIILLLPLLHSMIFAGGSSRFKGTSIFYTKEGEKRPFNIELAGQLTRNYLSHYSPKFLFLGGHENYRLQMQKVGPLLIIQAPFLLIGLIYLLKHRQKPWAKLLLWWFLAGPIAAVIGLEAPHQVRAFNLLPALTIITTIGLTQSFKKPLFVNLIALFFIFNLGYFLYRYFIHYPIYSAPDWQYGYQQVAEIASDYESQVNKIIITGHYGQPHVFILVYQQRKPYQVFGGDMIKYKYHQITWLVDKEFKDVLLIGSPEEIPAEAPGLIKEIYFPDGQPAFRVVRTSGDKMIDGVAL